MGTEGRIDIQRPWKGNRYPQEKSGKKTKERKRKKRSVEGTPKKDSGNR